MGCRVLTGTDGSNDVAVLYCSTSETAFGPVFRASECGEPEERAEAFIRYVTETTGKDPRALDSAALEEGWGRFLVAERRAFHAGRSAR